MKKTIVGTALAVMMMASWGAAGATDRAALAKKQSSLASEYTLAKDSNFYFVFDVLGRKLPPVDEILGPAGFHRLGRTR
jgi:hypothetical protein